MKAIVLNGSLEGRVEKEVEAVYKDNGDASTSLIKYSMLVMLCQSVRDDPTLTAASRRDALMGILASLNATGAPALKEAPPKEPPAEDFTRLLEGTRWKVAAYDADGNRGAFDTGTPWEFHANSAVNAGDKWTGTWEKEGPHRIRMRIHGDYIGGSDEFSVDLLSSSEFAAFQKGKRFRWGEKL